VKILKQGLGLVLLAASLSAVPALQTAAAGAPAAADDNHVQSMRKTADGDVVVRPNPATGKVGFVRTKDARGDLLPDVAADRRADAIAKADAYVKEHARAFGAPAAQLERSEVFADEFGWSITYSQSYRGVPVFAGELKAHVDKQGDLTAVNGFVAPDIDVSTAPRFSGSEAGDRALTMVKENPSGHEDALPEAYRKGLEIRSNELMIYRTGSTRGIDGEAKLAWVTEVWNKSTVRETVILDAQTGKHLNRWSMMAHALDRELYEGAHDPANLVWSEGDAFPAGLDEDQQNEVLGASETYWMFMNTFGRDSYDGAGATMKTVNNDPTINCPNANWNGVTTNYCTGVTGDDTVAHEWAHAYTEYTSGLIYQWQAGALNEAYSDIWGETVDMLNTRHNEGGETPDDTVLRTPGQCSEHTRSPITMEITAPAPIAGPCDAAPASFGPVIGQTPVTGTAFVAEDEANDDGPTTTDGCTAYTNPGDVVGNWAYVDRGTCTFATKAANAEAAGAIGIVVGNHLEGAPFSMSGSAEIYGVMVDLATGTDIKSEGEATFEVQAVPADTDDSYRWLAGETDPAFGGAIRDMWNPNCYGDPGKVSDEEYHCDASDSGGVHSNSGIVNRAFAILVDGLPGVVEPIGVDKAANLFWHAQTNYLTPSSFFPDMADALEASCVDLTGQDVNEVTLGNPTEPDGSDGQATPEVIAGGMTGSDCAAVTDAIAETELRLDPTEECAWEPLLQPGAPQLDCGDGFDVQTVFEEDFEDGLAGWAQDEELLEGWNDEGHGYAWEASTEAPDDHGGTVAFGPDPVEGSCAGDENDVSSRNGLISPEIEVPDGRTPRMQFDHWVATEAGWDGGNVKVSIDGGAFEQVPNEAYLFNAPGGQLFTLGAGNSNPMAGEDAWTGTDGGQLGGSWGTSIVDLSAIDGAAPGAMVQFRFDMGRDGCNGIEGWYVDNIAVQYCEKFESTTTLTVEPAVAEAGKDKVTLTASVSADEPAPTGDVLFKINGADLGTAALEDGVSTLSAGPINRTGTFELTAEYQGDDNTVPSASEPVTLRVVKATPTLKVKTKPKKVVVRKTRAKVIAVVKVGNQPAKGKVRVKAGGKKYQAKLNNKGRAVIKLKPFGKVGKKKVKVIYLGNAITKRAVKKVSIRVVRR
jgi:Zn-dependent metalloprotease